MPQIKRLSTNDDGFWQTLERHQHIDLEADARIRETVADILADVRRRGDAAVVDYTRRFDGLEIDAAADLEVPPGRLEQAWNGLDAETREMLEFSADRVRAYHEHQKGESWTYTEADGTILGQQVTPMDRAGLYVPGGKAVYPSCVVMNAIPAKVAGVGELVMVVPAPGGELNELVLAAAHASGVDRVFTIGGAQAVAALAYGTETIPRVDKIVGPGNIYVATAKGMVYGTVGIDMIAGPSEILVISDGRTDPDWIAMDLFSQAEHDEDAQPILVSPDPAHLDAVQASVDRLLPDMERADIIRQSLRNRALMIEVRDLDEAAEVANAIAPEHLELSLDDALEFAGRIRHAGAIFLGRYTAEAIGDYCAGPNHVLPTARTARFSSPLGVYDFQKRSSLIQCSRASASRLGRSASVFARREGLTAHARSAEYRIEDDTSRRDR